MKVDAPITARSQPEPHHQAAIPTRSGGTNPTTSDRTIEPETTLEESAGVAALTTPSATSATRKARWLLDRTTVSSLGGNRVIRTTRKQAAAAIATTAANGVAGSGLWPTASATKPIATIMVQPSDASSIARP